MIDSFESESFVLPSQVKDDVEGRLKDKQAIKSLELRVRGESLDGGKEFGQILKALHRRGVKISHEFSIKLEFPKAINRERALFLVENMPKSTNGSVKVKIQFASGSGTSQA
jgi:hypothetical protein